MNDRQRGDSSAFKNSDSVARKRGREPEYIGHSGKDSWKLRRRRKRRARGRRETGGEGLVIELMQTRRHFSPVRRLTRRLAAPTTVTSFMERTPKHSLVPVHRTRPRPESHGNRVSTSVPSSSFFSSLVFPFALAVVVIVARRRRRRRRVVVRRRRK